MYLTLVIIASVAYFLIIPKLHERYIQKKLDKWKDTPKDVVILHAPARGKTVPHLSPFVVKLETFLRMAKIPYEADISVVDAWGPKGRFPWISLNGQHMGDSQFIIEFLTKKFDVKLGEKYPQKENTVGSLVRIMMDEHFFWGIPYYRFVWGSFSAFKSTLGNVTSFADEIKMFLYQFYFYFQVKSRANGHGIGLHSREEIEKLTMKDLEYLSELMGDNKFLLGDEPSEPDCAVFAHLCQIMWGLGQGNIYQNSINGGRYPNLKSYVERMKTTFYPDWDRLIDK